MNTLSSWSDILRKDRSLIFAILNCTPDSFSDGGKYQSASDIESRIKYLFKSGADIIDFGSESTRPGASTVSYDEQMARLKPVLDHIDRKSITDKLFSIDTRNSAIAKECNDHGVNIVNDVSGGSFDPEMYATIASNDSLYILMHMRGVPSTMNEFCDYKDVVDEVCTELSNRVTSALDAGVKESSIMLDPGIGFAKTASNSLKLIKNVDTIKTRLGFPVMVGLSRKSFISKTYPDIPNCDNQDYVEWVTHYLGSVLSEQGIDALRVHEPLLAINAIKFHRNYTDI